MSPTLVSNVLLTQKEYQHTTHITLVSKCKHIGNPLNINIAMGIKINVKDCNEIDFFSGLISSTRKRFLKCTVEWLSQLQSGF